MYLPKIENITENHNLNTMQRSTDHGDHSPNGHIYITLPAFMAYEKGVKNNSRAGATASIFVKHCFLQITVQPWQKNMAMLMEMLREKKKCSRDFTTTHTDTHTHTHTHTQTNG